MKHPPFLYGDIQQAVDALHAGALVGLPTETVYGLAADAANAAAVAAIYATKSRPEFNPLILHVADTAMATRYAVMPAIAHTLANNYWPGALTLVLPRQPDAPVSALATAGLDSVAIRIPSHPIAQEVIKRFGRALAAPSANRSGRISPTCAGDVVAEFAHTPHALACVLDGGACATGVESTIVACMQTGVHLLRHGAITAEMLAEHVQLTPTPNATIHAPGMLRSHYAPNSNVRLYATEIRTGEALLAFGTPPALPVGTPIAQLSATQNLQEAAANLFHHLRALDALEPSCIAVMPIPTHGLGAAINDRLERAAADRT